MGVASEAGVAFVNLYLDELSAEGPTHLRRSHPDPTARRALLLVFPRRDPALRRFAQAATSCDNESMLGWVVRRAAARCYASTRGSTCPARPSGNLGCSELAASGTTYRGPIP
jgi:hypothetical protein